MRSLLTAAVAAIGFLLGAIVPTIAYESHPELDSALQQLIGARASLVASAPDRFGYRAKAIAETDRAIVDTRSALGFVR